MKYIVPQILIFAAIRLLKQVMGVLLKKLPWFVCETIKD